MAAQNPPSLHVTPATWPSRRLSRQDTLRANLAGQPFHGRLGRDGRARPRLAILYLHLAALQPLGTDDQLEGQPDQIHGGELAARPLLRVIVEHRDVRLLQLAIEALAR